VPSGGALRRGPRFNSESISGGRRRNPVGASSTRPGRLLCFSKKKKGRQHASEKAGRETAAPKTNGDWREREKRGGVNGAGGKEKLFE